ncbi:hypothetical protein CK203_040455 [Vitis vinifera]|uniref:Uncharacterized protein n=1 Tax=Vitis vinifera TaxID=29760 RepID=A0A438I8D0_VITVI|nr:hypothetical protein CK203_040455 [Vitis vinifera]
MLFTQVSLTFTLEFLRLAGRAEALLIAAYGKGLKMNILIAAGVFIVFGSMMECEGTVDDPDQKIPSFQKPQLLYQI